MIFHGLSSPRHLSHIVIDRWRGAAQHAAGILALQVIRQFKRKQGPFEGCRRIEKERERILAPL